jgi:FlaA1/EpsC-like NDP-sugar epimerase
LILRTIRGLNRKKEAPAQPASAGGSRSPKASSVHSFTGRLTRVMLTKLRGFLLSIRNRHLLLVDFAIFAITPALALLMRLNGVDEFDPYLGSVIIYTSIFLVLKPLLFWAVDLYNCYWPYASADALRALTKGAFGTFALELGVSFIVLYPLAVLPDPLPRSVPVISALLTIMLAGSTRLGVRMLFEMSDRRIVNVPSKPVLIVGAGAAGTLLVKQLRMYLEAGLQPVAFLDDDRRKLGARIYGLPVAGDLEDLSNVIKEYQAKEVIIAMPTAPDNVVHNIVQICNDAGITVRTMPRLLDFLNAPARLTKV